MVVRLCLLLESMLMRMFVLRRVLSWGAGEAWWCWNGSRACCFKSSLRASCRDGKVVEEVLCQDKR